MRKVSGDPKYHRQESVQKQWFLQSVKDSSTYCYSVVVYMLEFQKRKRKVGVVCTDFEKKKFFCRESNPPNTPKNDDF